MNKEIYNQDFAVYDVRKISKPNGLLMFTVKMNTDKFNDNTYKKSPIP